MESLRASFLEVLAAELLGVLEGVRLKGELLWGRFPDVRVITLVMTILCLTVSLLFALTPLTRRVCLGEAWLGPQCGQWLCRGDLVETRELCLGMEVNYLRLLRVCGFLGALQATVVRE